MTWLVGEVREPKMIKKLRNPDPEKLQELKNLPVAKSPVEVGEAGPLPKQRVEVAKAYA